MKISSSLTRVVCSSLIFSLITLPVAQAASPNLVPTEIFLSQQANLSPRDRVLDLLQREEVLAELQKQGVSPHEAKERLASLSDAEIAQLNQKIDALPAGADAAGAILGTALAVFLILLITDILCVTKVFKFTRCAG